MEDDSPGKREEGRSFWGGLRGLLFGGDGEATLRDQIEEAIESREGEEPRRGDLSHVERQMLLNILHFGEKNAGDVAVPRGDIYRRARRPPASRPWSPPSPRPATAACRSSRTASIR